MQPDFNKTNQEIEEIDLLELFNALWNKKILIIIFTFLFAILSVIYSLSLPNIYNSTATLISAEPDDSLSSQIGKYSSFASLAGIQIPDNSNKAQEAIERTKSYDFFVNHFLPYIKKEDLFAQSNWDINQNKLSYNINLYDEENKLWTRKVSKPFLPEPSNQELFKVYLNAYSIAQDKKTNFIHVSFEHISPYIAQEWLVLIINNINNYMKKLDQVSAQKSIDYLEKSFSDTKIAEIRVSMTSLWNEQLQILMMTDSNDDYIFKTISSPLVPEIKSKPNRKIICIFGTFLGFILGLIFALFSYYIHKKKD